MTLSRIIGRHKFALPALVFTAGTALSIALGVMTHQEIRRAARERFDAVATELARKVEGRFDDYVAVLAGVRARFNSTSEVRKDCFRQLSRINRPSIQSRWPSLPSMPIRFTPPAGTTSRPVQRAEYQS